ncbi:MAG: SUMF1/EgtB/PvdO family nonheme iron enzyme [Magnetococcales bacterium]|nr:SUMF1/EgtB/PvdO family nonheme iron enzyme [Magnetococcales bacterium]
MNSGVRFFLAVMLGVAVVGCASAPEPIENRIVRGSRVYDGGIQYEGDLVDGRRHGWGVQVWPDGARYEGMFRNDRRTGRGTFYWPSGSRYEGAFLDGRRHGEGVFFWPDGTRFEGQYNQGVKHGTGTHYSAEEQVVVCKKEPQQRAQVWENGQLLSQVLNAPATSMPTEVAVPSEAAGKGLNSSASPIGNSLAVAPVSSSTTSGVMRSAPLPKAAPVQKSIAQTVTQANSVAKKTENKMSQWKEPYTGLSFVRIPGGCFEMGSDEGAVSERPVHKVCVDGFWLSRHEVTQSQWQRVMGDNPSGFAKGGRFPVEQVSWHQVQAFTNALTARGSGGFRLPTEAEWEFACREGGKKGLTHCGSRRLSEQVWYEDNSNNGPHPVGTRTPNALGLFDMSGNVWEWVSDRYDGRYYNDAPEKNPPGPEQGMDRLFRGGAWLSEAAFVRPTLRYHMAASRGYNLLGFRLVWRGPTL